MREKTDGSPRLASAPSWKRRAFTCRGCRGTPKQSTCHHIKHARSFGQSTTMISDRTTRTRFVLGEETTPSRLNDATTQSKPLSVEEGGGRRGEWGAETGFPLGGGPNSKFWGGKFFSLSFFFGGEACAGPMGPRRLFETVR